jgi:hypothetical protein
MYLICRAFDLESQLVLVGREPNHKAMAAQLDQPGITPSIKSM